MQATRQIMPHKFIHYDFIYLKNGKILEFDFLTILLKWKHVLIVLVWRKFLFLLIWIYLVLTTNFIESKPNDTQINRNFAGINSNFTEIKLNFTRI